jgi:RNA polymerase sigma-70 factor (ECF subfamily)
MTAFEPTPPDERALLRELAEGSEEALAAIYDRTAPVLYPLALRIVGTRERACCVIEDLFEEVWNDRASLSGEFAVPVTRLIARCRDLALAQVGPELRRPMTAEGSQSEGAEIGPSRETGSSPSSSRRPMTEDLFTRDLGPFVSRSSAMEALTSLPWADRLALETAYFRGATANEIAMISGTTTTEASEMLRRALVRFREHIAQADPTADAMERDLEVAHAREPNERAAS